MNVLTSYTLAVGAWNTWPYLQLPCYTRPQPLGLSNSQLEMEYRSKNPRAPKCQGAKGGIAPLRAAAPHP